jgi:hypothetical protein
MKRWNILGLVGLIAVILMCVSGMWMARRAALGTFGSTTAQAEWDEWRKEAAEQSAAGGPVTRKVPKSTEPPALVLMRDHFPACVGAALVAVVGVYGTFILLLRGAMAVPVKGEREG